MTHRLAILRGVIFQEIPLHKNVCVGISIFLLLTLAQLGCVLVAHVVFNFTSAEQRCQIY